MLDGFFKTELIPTKGTPTGQPLSLGNALDVPAPPDISSPVFDLRGFRALVNPSSHAQRHYVRRHVAPQSKVRPSSVRFILEMSADPPDGSNPPLPPPGGCVTSNKIKGSSLWVARNVPV